MGRANRKDGTAWGWIRSGLGVIASGILKVSLFLGVIVTLSACFLSVYYYLLNSPHMRLEQVHMVGADPQTRDELIRMCGLDRGQGLLSLHLQQLKSKMETHPWVRSVRLERRFPHTLLVEVEKQVPAGLARLDDLYYVNLQGEIFKPVYDDDGVDFPVITGLSRKKTQVREELKQAMSVIRVLKSETGPWSVASLSELHLGKGGTVSLYFDHLKAEITFMWNELPQKMEALKRVAEHLNKSGKMDLVTRINLNYVDAAVVSYENG